MTMTTGYVQLPPRLAAPVPQVAPQGIAPRPARHRRIDRMTVGLLVGVGASAAFAGVSALALAALASLA